LTPSRVAERFGRAVAGPNRGGRLVAALLGLYAVGFTVWSLLPIGIAPDAAAFIGDIAMLPAGILVGAIAVRASRVGNLSSAARRGWRLLAVSFVVFWLGDVLFFYFDSVAQVSPSTSLADIPYLAYYPILLVGLLSFRTFFETRMERLKFALDATIVALGGGMVLWFFVLGPLSPGDNLLGDVISAAYPIGDLVMMVGVAAISVRAPRDLGRGTVRLLLAGLVVMLVADIVYGAQDLSGTYNSGGWITGIYLIGWALLGASATAAYTQSTTAPAAQDSHRRGDLPYLPYVAIALGYGILLLADVEAWSPTLGGLVIGAGGLTALVVLRQVAAVRENVRLVAEGEVRRTDSRFRSLVQNASDIIIVLDGNARIGFESPSIERVLGYRRGELAFSDLAALVHPDDRHELRAFQTVLEQPGATASARFRIQRADGAWLHSEVSATNLLADPDTHGVVYTLRDIDSQTRLESRLRHQAFHDSLTGLANRAAFGERVHQALDALPGATATITVLFLDLDNFKTINDSLGHDAGDKVLIEAARRLREATRSTDFCARFGGDEFAVLLSAGTTTKAAAAAARRILAALDEPMTVGTAETTLGASLGIADGTRAETREDVLRKADLAMYAAKRGGKARFVFFEAGMQTPAVARLDMVTALRWALERNELETFYQPIVDLETDKLVGAEALVRWNRPGIGLVLPVEFIPIAEETGLIVPIGRWVLQQAIQAAAGWLTVDGVPLIVTVNLSARQLEDDAFVGDVARILAAARFDPARLVLEVTESMVMEHPEATIERLTALRALGLTIAIDDFGTGYSSLSYLRTLPVDKVKIDRSFVADLEIAAGAALVQGIVTLGHSLGLGIVAEGIENAEHAAALRSMGCELGQGYLYSRPVSLPEFEQLLRAAHTDPAPLAEAS
jgi:diguanylate cyclase (GGDEF)-like protein/PAS domain S-box-containing protein